jgi:signal transduction histidine kinase
VKAHRPRKRLDSSSLAGLEQAHRRLEHLYEINKLFMSFETVEKTFDAALGIAAKTLPIVSAIVIEVQDGRSRMITWPSGGQSSAQVQAAKEHVQDAYAYLVGAVSSRALALDELGGHTALPPQAESRAGFASDRRFIVIPLVVGHRPIFGALQLESATAVDKTDLMFVNALANQLAIALDRHHAWQRDIASRDRAETAIREREQILAIVSHELMNPLGAVLLTTDYLARNLPTENQGKWLHGLETVQHSTERMQRLIADLLDFASIQAGRLAMKRQPQDPRSILAEALGTFEADAEAKKVRLLAEAGADLPRAYCDRDRVLQVLSNLVGNALKVTGADGRVSLRAEGREHEVMFAVSDSGPGISAEDLDHIFERFWRGREAGYKGTGLGLSIARGIVEAHGGRIWAESKVGKGTTFFLTLPAVDVDEAALKTAQANQSAVPRPGH